MSLPGGVAAEERRLQVEAMDRRHQSVRDPHRQALTDYDDPPFGACMRRVSHPDATAFAQDEGIGFAKARVLLSVMRDPTRVSVKVRVALVDALLKDKETRGLWAEGTTFPAYWVEGLGGKVKKRKAAS